MRILLSAHLEQKIRLLLFPKLTFQNSQIVTYRINENKNYPGFLPITPLIPYIANGNLLIYSICHMLCIR